MGRVSCSQLSPSRPVTLNAPVTPPPLCAAPKRGDLLASVMSARARSGDLFRLPIGRSELVFVCHPELAYDVLVHQKDVFVKSLPAAKPAGLQRVLGGGLLTVSGRESWFKSRRVLQPAFHARQIAGWTGKILRSGERLVTRLKSLGRMDLQAELLQAGLELSYELLFSLPPERVPDYPLKTSLSLATASEKQVRTANWANDAVISRILAERRALAGNYGDLLELLLTTRDADTGEGLSDRQIRDELLTLLAAGHETAANALSWALHLVYSHPEVLARLRAELNAQVPPSRRPYLRATFKEALRLYPVIPYAPRTPIRNTTLGGFDVKAGSKLLVCIYAVQRHPVFWEEPDAFQPERFLVELTQPQAYFPFGLGERFCLGRNLALLQGELWLSLLIRAFDMIFGAEPERKLAVSLAPRGGLPVRLEVRQP